MKCLLILVTLITFLPRAEAQPALSETKNVSLVSLQENQAVFRVSVCPVDAPVRVEMGFTTHGDELAVARIRFLTPAEHCYAATSRLVSVDLTRLMKESAAAEGIRQPFLQLRALPFSLEVNN